MNVLSVGLTHRNTEVRMLERVAISPEDTPKILDELMEQENLSEVMVLSTCNRVEIYALAETFHGGVDDITAVLARHSGCAVGELAEYLYVCYAGAAVEHLFSVASGLDSMVLGEAQVLGQLRSAYAVADETGTVGRVLHDLAQHALRVGKRVHSETDIDSAGASVVSEALSDATELLGDLSGRRALLVGAGSMGALASTALGRAGISEIVVANRSHANGERLAETVADEGVPSRVSSLDALPHEVAAADLVVTCTGAVGAVLPVDTVTEAMAARVPARPLVVCDLGLPRDTEPEVADVRGVNVVDLVTLQQRLSQQRGGDESERATSIVSAEVQAFLAAQRSAEVTPTVTALRRRASEVVDAELLRLDARVPELDEDTRNELRRTVKRVADKLLHAPTVRVKELAAHPDGADYAAALRELFELESNTAAVSAVRMVDGGRSSLSAADQAVPKDGQR